MSFGKKVTEWPRHKRTDCDKDSLYDLTEEVKTELKAARGVTDAAKARVKERIALRSFKHLSHDGPVAEKSKRFALKKKMSVQAAKVRVNKFPNARNQVDSSCGRLVAEQEENPRLYDHELPPVSQLVREQKNGDGNESNTNCRLRKSCREGLCGSVSVHAMCKSKLERRILKSNPLMTANEIMV